MLPQFRGLAVVVIFSLALFLYWQKNLEQHHQHNHQQSLQQEEQDQDQQLRQRQPHERQRKQQKRQQVQPLDWDWGVPFRDDEHSAFVPLQYESPHQQLVVITFCKEDVSWSCSLMEFPRVFISKCGLPAPTCDAPQIVMPYTRWAAEAGRSNATREWPANARSGRAGSLVVLAVNGGYECYGILNFIAYNYHRLPDYTLFLHGEPFHDTASLRDGTSLGRLFEPFKRGTSKVDYFPLSKQDFVHTLSWKIPTEHVCIGNIWKALTGQDPPVDNMTFWPNGQFFVHKRAILRWPRRFWFKALNIVTSPYQYCDPTTISWEMILAKGPECYALEPLWGILFGFPWVLPEECHRWLDLVHAVHFQHKQMLPANNCLRQPGKLSKY